MRFRPFFILAALFAMVPVAVWLPGLLGGDFVAINGQPLAIWHGQEMLFGLVPTTWSGFMLTSVPRWTRRELVPRHAVLMLVPLWFAARLGMVAAPMVGQVLAAAFLVALAAIVVGNVVAARDGRDAKIALLLSLFALAGCIARFAEPGSAAQDFGFRLGFAAVVCILMIISGRIISSLTENFVLVRTGAEVRLREPEVEAVAGVLAPSALAAWVIAPESEFTLVLAGGAAVAHALRLVQWQGWRVVRNPPALVLHLAYAWLPLGFALLAWHILDPGRVSVLAAEHAWGIGGPGALCLGIMSSMIRRHAGRAYVQSPAASLCYLCALCAALARLISELAPAQHDPALLAAVMLWLAAFGLFLVAFGKRLLFWPGADAKPPPVDGAPEPAAPIPAP